MLQEAHAPAANVLTERPEVLVVGALGPARRRLSERAAQRADVQLRFAESVQRARMLLRDPAFEVPRAILLEQGPEVAAFVSWCRGEARYFSVPILLTVRRPTEAAYAEAHAMGADDVVLATDVGGLTRRLARLAEVDPSRRPPTRMGRALLVSPDVTSRRLLGRVLRMAGFAVDFAAGLDEALQLAARRQDASLMVLGAALGEAGGEDLRAPLRALREAMGAPELPAVLLCERGEQLARCRRALTDEPAVATVARRGPADDLLFVANELLRPGVRELRASDRLLHGTLCAFRPAGVFEHGYGLTYNISREGLFVRTLDPPPPGQGLWIELRPPGHGQVVHLRARLVWTRSLGGQGGAAPPGFGLRFEEEACPQEDLRAYRRAYEQLRERVHGSGGAHSAP